jgi:hypothetical protein
MYIGDHRTKHPIRAFRTPAEPVVIPKGKTLHDVRTRAEPAYRFPIAMRVEARNNVAMHIFEYAGETLYMHFAHGLMEATMGIEPEYGSR